MCVPTKCQFSHLNVTFCVDKHMGCPQGSFHNNWSSWGWGNQKAYLTNQSDGHWIPLINILYLSQLFVWVTQHKERLLLRWYLNNILQEMSYFLRQVLVNLFCLGFIWCTRGIRKGERRPTCLFSSHGYAYSGNLSLCPNKMATALILILPNQISSNKLFSLHNFDQLNTFWMNLISISILLDALLTAP